MKRILVINNAYPSQIKEKAGGYVKSIELCLIEAGLSVESLVLVSDYTSGFQKLIAYIKFYFKLFFKRYSIYNYIYIHHFPYVFIPLIFKFRNMRIVVVNFHGEDIVYTSLLSKWLNAISYRFLSTKFLYIFPSKYFKDKALGVIPKLKSAKLYVSPSGGVDTDVFKPLVKKMNTQRSINIGFASGMDYNKGVEDLLCLLEEFKDLPYNFHIIDYGKQRNKYINAIKAFENVTLYSTFKKEEMPIFYSKIDVLFLPTKSESLGLVALEAMCCNIPVIGPDDFALSVIIVNGVTGEKYNLPGNKEVYLSTFDKFKKNRLKYTPMNHIKRLYSKNEVVKQFKQIFE